MIEDPKNKTHHLNICDGTIMKSSMSFDLKSSKPIVDKIKHTCEKRSIVFSLGFKPRVVNVGECVLRYFKEIELVKM